MSFLYSTLRRAMGVKFPTGISGLSWKSVLGKVLPVMRTHRFAGIDVLKSLYAQGYQPSRSTFYEAWKEAGEEGVAELGHSVFYRGGVEPYRYSYHITFRNPAGEIHGEVFEHWSANPLSKQEAEEQILSRWKYDPSESEKKMIQEYGDPEAVGVYHEASYPHHLP